MGFNLNKARAKKDEIIHSFHPLDLNEGNVQALFNRCVATESTTEYIKAFMTMRGYAKAETDRRVEELFQDLTAKGQADGITKEQLTREFYDDVIKLMNFYEETNSKFLLFDKQKLLANLKQIRYLYGQLLTVHKHTNSVCLPSEENEDKYAVPNYLEQIWTTNRGIALQFGYLGIASGTIYPFTENGCSGFQNVGIQPTLSPKDPGFPAWWEAHKGEWE